MAWICTILPEEAQGKLEEVYSRIQNKRGGIAEIYRIQSLDPQGLEHHLEMYLDLMFARSPLSRFQRELIGVVVSQVNECHY
jgi:alkylhydroperoxidase family enzyme